LLSHCSYKTHEVGLQYRTPLTVFVTWQTVCKFTIHFWHFSLKLHV